MTGFEILSLLVSILAVAIAAISLVRTRRIAAKQLELQHVTAELSRKQLEIINSEEEAQTRALIDVELEGSGSNYKFVISNYGGAEAKDVHFHLGGEGEGNPLVGSEYAHKIPIKSLKPGKSVTLIAALTLGSPAQFNTFVRWINPDGSEGREEYFVSV
ncbi:MAG: hypothetical protein RPU15_17310 [Candidatus Sedimenticola sp. (ex Thyasira tokunagai)]